jgi:gamma-glutamyl-gamma-aminobutyrate hydrolase PuuD
MVGVQWHAECLVDRPPHGRLFAEFVEAARRFEHASDGLALAA